MEGTIEAGNRYERRLLMAQTFPLNKSCSKQVCVGLDWQKDDDFKPALQLWGLDPRKKMQLNEKQWGFLDKQLEHILAYYNMDNCPDFYRKFSVIECDDLVISFTTSHKHRAVTFDKKKNRLVMHQVSMQELARRSHQIGFAMNELSWLPSRLYKKQICEYFSDIYNSAYIYPPIDVVQKKISNEYFDMCDTIRFAVKRAQPEYHHSHFETFFGDIVHGYFD